MLPLIDELRLNRLDPATLPAGPVDALYVHIPFCFHKCHYCDFYSITRQSTARMGHFVDLVLREAELWNRQTQVQVQPVTIFFGGGTPSLLPLEAMEKLILGLRQRLDFGRADEFTIEVNPATTSLDYLSMLRGVGVTRLSMGAQSFDVADLMMLERHHRPEQVEQSVELARRAGFARISVDLIYAIPNQSLESWCATLTRALALRLDHYSCYALTYEPTTPLAVRRRLGQVSAASESLELELMWRTRQMLGDAGINAYEISNYAACGQECRHNLHYWRGGSYIGLGPSAASHVDGTRFKNLPHLREWEESIAGATLPAADVERLTPQQRAGERMMLGLRLSRGVDRATFADEFGTDPAMLFCQILPRLEAHGLVQVGPTIRLTEAGIAVADAVAAEFLV